MPLWMVNAKNWIYAIFAAAFAALLAFAAIERKEKRSAQDELAAHEAKQDAATAQAQLGRVEMSNAIEQDVAAMPKAPVDPQPVADAPAGTSAADLHAHWSRD